MRLLVLFFGFVTIVSESIETQVIFMSASNRIPTNLRTLMILEIIGHSDHALSPTEINQKLGLPKQSIHRLVSTLEEEGFLLKDEGGNKYRPSRRLRLMGSGLLHASRVSTIRHQILREIADTLGEAVNYVVPEEAGMKYLDRVETHWPFRVQLPRGSNVPFHCTASGKVFMASLKPSMRKRFVYGLNLEAITDRTHTDPEKLLTELKSVAKNGFSIDNEEFIDEMVAVAVPVKDTEDRLIAVLATHGPKSRMSLEEFPKTAELLKVFAIKLRDAILE